MKSPDGLSKILIECRLLNAEDAANQSVLAIFVSTEVLERHRREEIKCLY